MTLFLTSALAMPGLAGVPRPADVVGEVVAANGGEEIRFFDAAAWQSVDVAQDLVPGDVLRTGPYGLLAILFRDETQVRLQRNSIMRVERVGARGSSVGSLLRLDLGAIWSRARPVADGLQIETPSATAAIRGTDWALSVGPDGTSTLVVLSGRIEFFNELGRVTVERGEQATARIGQAPVKRYLIDPQDKPRWALYLNVEWMQMLSLTGERLTDLRAERAGQDPAALQAGGDAAAILRAAEVAYDLGDVAGAERLADLTLPLANIDQTARVNLLQGLVALQRRRYTDAEVLLTDAPPRLAGRPAMVLQLGLMWLAVETNQPETAARLIAATEAAFPDQPEAALAHAWLLSFAGEHETASDLTIRTAERFPNEASPHFLLSHRTITSPGTGSASTTISTLIVVPTSAIRS